MQSQHFWPLPVCRSLLIQLLWGSTHRNFQRAACAQLELQDVARMISTVSAGDEHVGPVELRVENQPESDALPCCRAVWSGMREKHPVCVLLEQKGTLGVCCQSHRKPVPTDGGWELGLCGYFTQRWSEETGNEILKDSTTSLGILCYSGWFFLLLTCAPRIKLDIQG